jgi:hypothetical protein
MQKKILLLIFNFSLLLFNSVTAQVTFQKLYGGSGLDSFFKLAKTSDGGYVCAGLTESFGNLPRDIYLFKTDANGVHQWSVAYSGIGYDYATNIIKTSDNGFLIAGGTTSFGSGSDDALLLKTDATGAIVWSKVYGGPQQDYFMGVAQTNDSGYIAVGTTLSFGAGSNDIFIVRTNSTGDTLWTRTIGGAGYDELTCVTQTTDNGFALCGRSSSFTAANTDALLLKLNQNGDTAWTVQYGNFGAEEAFSVKQTYDGGYIVFGNATSFGNDYELYLNRFDGTGNLLWGKLYGGAKSDALYDGIITSDSGFAMCGFTESFGEGHTRGTDSSNYFLIRTNMNGDTLWTHTYGGDKVDESFGLLQADDGGFVVLGFSGSFGDSVEAYLVKTNSMGLSGCHELPSNPHVITPTTLVSSFPAPVTSGCVVGTASFIGINPATHENILCLFDGINEAAPSGESCVVFPNPFTNHTTIKFGKKIDDGILYLYNMLGQLVLEKSNITGTETVINAENISSGIHVFELIEKGKKIYNGKMVVY